MLYSEYLNSDGMNRSYDVFVNRNDCYQFQNSAYKDHYAYVGLKIKDQVFYYTVLKNETTLKIRNSNGEWKSSCFRLQREFNEIEIVGIANLMRNNGGAFEKLLGEGLLISDKENQTRLENAFPETIEKFYIRMTEIIPRKMDKDKG